MKQRFLTKMTLKERFEWLIEVVRKNAKRFDQSSSRGNCLLAFAVMSDKKGRLRRYNEDSIKTWTDAFAERFGVPLEHSHDLYIAAYHKLGIGENYTSRYNSVTPEIVIQALKNYIKIHIDKAIPYPVGTKLRVIDRKNGHYFQIGEIIEVVDVVDRSTDKANYIEFDCKDENDDNRWYLNHREVEAV